MLHTIQDALEVLRKDRVTEDEYRFACEYLVANRGQLTQRVFINLPGGRGGNADPAWAKVKAGSKERCGCGNERVIIPLNQRTEYEPSEAGTVIVTKGHAVFLKPVGGDKPSAYLELKIEAGAITFLEDPFAPFILTPDLFSTKGYKLEMLAEVMPKQPKPPVFVRKSDGVQTPIFAINAVDMKRKRSRSRPTLPLKRSIQMGLKIITARNET